MNINILQELVNTLSTYIGKKDVKNEKVSEANVGWHIEHTLLTIVKITNATKYSSPGMYKWKFNLMRTFVFALKKMPRGKAKAPKAVVPIDNATFENLNQLKEKALQNISILNYLDEKNYFTHPYFGDLKLSHAIKTLVIHTTHHLNIINDILVNKR